MSRALRTPHAALPSYTTADALFLLRCDEAGGANDLRDALAQRTMTQTASPGAAYSLFEDRSQPAARGARTFNGTTQYAGRTHDADQSIFAAAAWGWEGWFNPTSIASTMTFLEFGEFGGTDATGPLMRCRITSSGTLRLDWRDSGGSARNNETPAGLISAGVAVHLGIAVRPSRTVHQAQDILFYVNGACVSIITGRPLPASGTSARWIVGASRAGGAAVNTPGEFYAGSIDDLIFVPWTPNHEWFAEAYANGVCNFFEKYSDQDNTGAPFGTLQEVHTRVLIEVSPDGSAFTQAGVTIPLVNQTDLNLTDVMGDGFLDFVKSVSFKDAIDDTGPSATIQMFTRYAFWNLSPLDDISPLQTVFQARRRIKILQACVPIGFTRDGAKPFYRLMFDGWAMNPDIDPDNAQIQAIGAHSPLLQAWVEPAPTASANENAAGDRFYGAARPGGRAIESCIGDIILDHDPSRFSIVAKSSADVGGPNGIEGTGPGGNIQIRVYGQGDEHGKGRPHPFANADSVLVSATTNFNGVYTANGNTTTLIVEVSTISAAAAEQSGIVQLTPQHSYRGTYPEVWVPTSPGYNMFLVNEPPTKSVLAAIQSWCDEIGWVYRSRWDDTRKAWRMKLYDPRVSGGGSTVVPDTLYKPGAVSLKHDFQRTAGTIEYASDAKTDNKGENTRYVVGFGDLARNGDRYYFRVVNDSKSLITNSTDAQKELDALKNDLGKDPSQNADGEVTLSTDHRWELTDLFDVLGEYALAPLQMPMFFGYESFPYVSSVETFAEHGKQRTTVKLMKFAAAGATQPAGRQDWHFGWRLGPIGRQPGFGLRSPNAPGSPSLSDIGSVNLNVIVFVSWAFPVGDQNRAFDIMEVHRSTTNNFAPSSSTLRQTTRATAIYDTGGMSIGTTYYYKLVATDGMGNRSAPSAQSSITP